MHEAFDKREVFGAPMALAPRQSGRVCAPLIACETQNMPTRAAQAVHAVNLFALLVAGDEDIGASLVDFPLAVEALC